MISHFFRLTAILLSVVPSFLTAAELWQDVEYITGSSEQKFPATVYGNPFSGSDRSILRIVPEAAVLEGVRLPLSADGVPVGHSFTLNLEEPALLLVAASSRDAVRALDLGGGELSASPLLRSAVAVTELPELHIYGVNYPEGSHTVSQAAGGEPVIILGAVRATESFTGGDAGLGNGLEYPSFPIEGFSEKPALFTIIGGPDCPVIDEGMSGTESIQGGFEGGQMIKIGDTYHAFPTERAGEPGRTAEYDRIKTRIGHWTSKDAVNWQRQSTLYQASGKYAVSHYDNPANDRRAAIWSYMPIFNSDRNRWQGHYLAYTCDSVVEPNHSFGRIWRCESETEGIEGIGGPYRDCGIVIEPGLDSQLWEGRQGVASFFPYQVGDRWYAFISGAYPYLTEADYPFGGKPTNWYVGLAEADSLEGPWTRMKEINPITSIHPRFVENPIVSRLPGGMYIAMFDGGPEWLNLPNMIAYTLSADGINWREAHYLPIDTKVERWWDTMRTPLGLIPEGDDIYTIVYAAVVNGRRFHPMGMVKVKLDRNVLEKLSARMH